MTFPMDVYEDAMFTKSTFQKSFEINTKPLKKWLKLTKITKWGSGELIC